MILMRTFDCFRTMAPTKWAESCFFWCFPSNRVVLFHWCLYLKNENMDFVYHARKDLRTDENTPFQWRIRVNRLRVGLFSINLSRRAVGIICSLNMVKVLSETDIWCLTKTQIPSYTVSPNVFYSTKPMPTLQSKKNAF